MRLGITEVRLRPMLLQRFLDEMDEDGNAEVSEDEFVAFFARARDEGLLPILHSRLHRDDVAVRVTSVRYGYHTDEEGRLVARASSVCMTKVGVQAPRARWKRGAHDWAGQILGVDPDAGGDVACARQAGVAQRAGVRCGRGE